MTSDTVEPMEDQPPEEHRETELRRVFIEYWQWSRCALAFPLPGHLANEVRAVLGEDAE